MAITNNQVVSIEYTLTEKGQSEVLDTNKGQAPLDFIMGMGMIISGLEESIKNMSKGESAVVEIPALGAYGEREEEAVQTLPKEQFAGVELEKGMQLYGQSEDGQTVMVTVADFDDKTVTVDYNHPLAGKDLAFDLTILDVRDATDEEINTGVIGGDSCGCGTSGCH
jgi:FKBP-type peptidyl-prolyl cis-trans isomerase SlyD